jgi:VanZ family protein
MRVLTPTNQETKLIRSFFVVASLMAMLAICVLSVVPGELRPHTQVLPPPVEHVAAYLIAGFLLRIGYSGRIPPFRLVLLLTGYGALLELAQVWIPDRSPAPTDIVADLIGALIGVTFGSALLYLRRTVLLAR